MNLLETVGIAFGVAMDVVAMSVASGVVIREQKVRHAIRIALFFGGFQALMLLVGWLAGLSLKGFITHIDHWVAFGLLSAIGCKMIYEAIKLQPGEKRFNPLNTITLLVLSIATSIDALAVGITLSFLHSPIVTPVVIVGVVTFAMSIAGMFIGDRFGHFLESKAEIVGGLVLIGIGVKILAEHFFRA